MNQVSQQMISLEIGIEWLHQFDHFLQHIFQREFSNLLEFIANV